MSLAPSSPKSTLDKTCITGKAEEPCNVTDDNQGPDCYESMHAFKKIRTSTSGLRKSPNKWTKEENQKLAALVASYGEKKWKRISAEMGGQKTGAQCAQHWKRVLSPEIRKGHWDENEEDLLLRLVVQYGSCWKKIAKKIPQRTDIQCRYQYLKAKQSREVMWDAKEDESLIKRVMEMANCNFFHIIDDTNNNITNSTNNAPSNTSDTNPLRSSVNATFSANSPNPIGPVNYNKKEDGGLSSSSDSDVKEEDYEMKSSGEVGRDGAWNDDKNNVNMSDSSNATFSIGDGDDRNTCANCHSPAGSHVNKVVWLEISEHMARLKLTSTLRTALECKTRFAELLGNKISFSAPNNFCLNNNSPESNSDIKHRGLKSSGDISGTGFGGIGGNGIDGSGTANAASRIFHNNMNDTNINIKINTNNNNITNNSNNYIPNNSITNSTTTTTTTAGNNINISNCNNNSITINITNSYTTANTSQNGINFPRISQSTSSPPTPISTKTELTSGPSLLPKTSVPPILSPAPPFPSFSHLSHPSFPHVSTTATLKPSRSVQSGLESLAAVASILPREMLADYAQF